VGGAWWETEEVRGMVGYRGSGSGLVGGSRGLLSGRKLCVSHAIFDIMFSSNASYQSTNQSIYLVATILKVLE